MNKRQYNKDMNNLLEEILVDGWVKSWLTTPYQRKMIRRHRKRFIRESKIVSPIKGLEKK